MLECFLRLFGGSDKEKLLMKSIEISEQRLQDAYENKARVNNTCLMLRQEYKLVHSGAVKFATPEQKKQAEIRLKADLVAALRQKKSCDVKEQFCLKVSGILQNQMNSIEMAAMVKDLTGTLKVVANPIDNADLLASDLEEVGMDIDEAQADMSILQDAINSATSGIDTFGTDEDTMNQMLEDFLNTEEEEDHDVEMSGTGIHGTNDTYYHPSPTHHNIPVITTNSVDKHTSGSRILFDGKSSTTPPIHNNNSSF